MQSLSHAARALAAVFLLPALLWAAETYPGTQSLTIQGDVAAQMVAGIDRFLLQQIDASVAARAEKWKWDFSSPAAHQQAIAANRDRLAHLLGVRESREPFDAPQLLATAETNALVAQGRGFDVYAVRWPVLKNLYGEGLLLTPTAGKVVADVVAIPDADQTPEQIAGLAAGIPAESQFARRLAESGCRVLVPTLISREMSPRRGRANLSNREFVFRTSFVQGRHVIGFEIQKVLAGVDWFAQADGDDRPIGVIGYGEGGMLALYSAALDDRIERVCVSGYVAPREAIWREPISRNVFGRLERFGDAELLSMIWPRTCVVERAAHPSVALPGEGGAPGEITTPSDEAVSAELTRVANAKHLIVGPTDGDPQTRPFGTMLAQFLPAEASLATTDGQVEVLQSLDPTARQLRQMQEMDDYDQTLLAVNEFVRKDFMKGLDFSSVEAYEASAEKYREIFYNDVIGRFDLSLLPANAQTRKTWDEEKWVGYEVKLDVFPHVFAYGVLLLPKDLQPGERRPVVVCQHGLEGRPTDCFDGTKKAYNNFAADLCEQGYIVFAPQNPYIGKDDFRTLQRKSNALGKTLFSTIVPQHQQIVDWLQTLPCVDGERIAFYGLSYGGKSAMRIPALVPDYCLSICSGDFNDWVLKTASSRHRFSYVWTSEYEIYEFDLGSTFNYAEMAALICPRPFMVERGHYDGCGDDEFIGWEFGKVIYLYQGKLHLTDKTEIEHFIGGHEIHSQGTFAFLEKHLDFRPRQ